MTVFTPRPVKRNSPVSDNAGRSYAEDVVRFPALNIVPTTHGLIAADWKKPLMCVMDVQM